MFPDSGCQQEEAGNRGREQPSAGTSATGHSLHLSARQAGLTGTERGKLGRWRGARRGWQASRAQHARESRPGHFFLWQSRTMGRVQGYITPY